MKQFIQEVSVRIKDEKPPSLATLSRWVIEYERKGNSSLASKNHLKGGGGIRLECRIAEIVNSIYQQCLKDNKRIVFTEITSMVKSEVDAINARKRTSAILEMPSYCTIRRLVKAYLSGKSISQIINATA